MRHGRLRVNREGMGAVTKGHEKISSATTMSSEVRVEGDGEEDTSLTDLGGKGL